MSPRIVQLVHDSAVYAELGRHVVLLKTLLHISRWSNTSCQPVRADVTSDGGRRSWLGLHGSGLLLCDRLTTPAYWTMDHQVLRTKATVTSYRLLLVTRKSTQGFVKNSHISHSHYPLSSSSAGLASLSGKKKKKKKVSPIAKQTIPHSNS